MLKSDRCVLDCDQLSGTVLLQLLHCCVHYFFFIVLQIGLSLLGITIVVAVVNYWLLIPAAVMFSVFYILRVYFLATSRSIKRLEAISKFVYLLI